jgi:putative membrane protein
MAWHTGAGMGWWMVFGGFLWVIFWGTVIYFFVSLIRSPQPRTSEKQDDPIEVAKRRYAGGQITRDEYERIRHDLAA